MHRQNRIGGTLAMAALLAVLVPQPADAATRNADCEDWSEAPAAQQGDYRVTASGLHPPLTCYRVTSAYGPRIHPVDGRESFHAGIDLGAPTGSPVLALAAGRVSRASRTAGAGNLVVVDHPDGRQSRYAHMQVRFVETGERVAAGTVLGLVGSKGRSTGPHLHLEILVDGNPVDPAPLIAAVVPEDPATADPVVPGPGKPGPGRPQPGMPDPDAQHEAPPPQPAPDLPLEAEPETLVAVARVPSSPPFAQPRTDGVGHVASRQLDRTRIAQIVQAWRAGRPVR